LNIRAQHALKSDFDIYLLICFLDLEANQIKTLAKSF